MVKDSRYGSQSGFSPLIALGDTNVDTGGECTKPAVLPWEGLRQIRMAEAFQAIRHQCQCWVRAEKAAAAAVSRASKTLRDLGVRQ
jgi:hypothetical protein